MGSISLNRQEKTNSSVVPAEHSPNPFFPAIPVLLRCIDAQGEAILNCCKEIDFRIGVEPALPAFPKKHPANGQIAASERNVREWGRRVHRRERGRTRRSTSETDQTKTAMKSRSKDRQIVSRNSRDHRSQTGLQVELCIDLALSCENWFFAKRTQFIEIESMPVFGLISLGDRVPLARRSIQRRSCISISTDCRPGFSGHGIQ
jgi:hypothetical protein